jgi:hypothetical protein
MKVELAIRYVGLGLTCNNCGKLKETTRYELRAQSTGELISEFRLCDSCQDSGFVIKFNIGAASAQEFLRARRIQRSKKMETDLAEDVKGKRQPGSGNKDEKADVRVMGSWRLEHKFTDSIKGYTLLVRDLSTVIKHANQANEWPALITTFARLGRKFATIPYEVFLELMEVERAARDARKSK